jgi:hypothetical protein
MGPRLRLMHLAGTAAAMLCLVAPALAQDEVPGVGLAPAYDFAVPAGSESLNAKDDPVPGERQVPRPAPSGCPFRDGKLELIV